MDPDKAGDGRSGFGGREDVSVRVTIFELGLSLRGTTVGRGSVGRNQYRVVLRAVEKNRGWIDTTVWKEVISVFANPSRHWRVF